MKIKIQILIFLTGLALASPLSWQECVALTIKNNPELIVAREKLYQSEIQLQLTKVGKNPNVNLSGSLSSGGAFGAANNSAGIGISAKQLLIDNGSLASEIAIANNNLESLEYDYLIKSSDLRYSLRQNFLQFMQAKEYVKVSNSILQTRKESYELVKLRYEGGREHKGSLLAAEANYEQAKYEASRALRELTLATKRLSRVIGVSENLEIKEEDLSFAQKLQEPNFLELTEQSVLLSKMLIVLETAKENLKVAQVSNLPSIYLSAAVRSSFSDSSGSWSRSDSWSLGSDVSFTLFDNGARDLAIASKRSQLNLAELDLNFSKEDVLIVLMENFKSLKDASESLSVQKKYLEAAEARATISQAQYGSGLITFNDWINIEDNLVNVKKNFLNAQIALQMADAKWQQAKGGTLENEIK